MSIMKEYKEKLEASLRLLPQENIERFFEAVLSVWRKDAQVFICGNGGSAANAMHLANDLFYGIAKDRGRGIRTHALTVNQSILTCLANDLTYGEIFSSQLELLANPGDLLIAFSGSGNSPNVLNALKKAKEKGMTSVAVLGYSGGAALSMADLPVHVPVHDMQIAEDLQLIISHALMQWLYERNPHRQK